MVWPISQASPSQRDSSKSSMKLGPGMRFIDQDAQLPWVPSRRWCWWNCWTCHNDQLASCLSQAIDMTYGHLLNFKARQLTWLHGYISPTSGWKLVTKKPRYCGGKHRCTIKYCKCEVDSCCWMNVSELVDRLLYIFLRNRFLFLRGLLPYICQPTCTYSEVKWM